MNVDRTAPIRAPAWFGDIPEEMWAAAVRALRDAGEDGEGIALACHEDPDGDALGSMLALHLFLRRLGWQSVASWGSEPFTVPPQYTFLPGLETLVPPSEFPREPELLVCFDAATPARLGSLEEVVAAAKQVIKIDHHSSGEEFGDIELVSPRAPATAVIVDELLRRLGGRPDREIATCLYTGLVTDTGRFQSPTTDPATMELGGRLLAEGIEHEQMSRQMFETHSFGYLKLLARVLDRATFDAEARLVFAWLEHEDLSALGVALDETEGLIDVLRTTEAADVVMVLKELPDGSWRGSLRSKEGTDVATVAEALGGGGHAHSAAFVNEGERDEIVAQVVEALSAARPGSG